MNPTESISSSPGEGTSPEVASLSHSDAKVGECACPRCGLYKWYPPLLLLSTILAGVFCWMYVTKPVFLSQPREIQPADSTIGLPAGDPGSGGKQWDPSPVVEQGVLDPAMEGLPGEVARADGVSAGGFQTVLQPLVVPRPQGQLFTPLVDAQNPGGAARGMEPADEGEGLMFDASASEESPEAQPAEADGGDRELIAAGGDPDLSSVSIEHDYEIGPSFMAEFLAEESASSSLRGTGSGSPDGPASP